ncbi:MAG: T9SS type A sorting domain-containing protein, partial [Flavobacteriaceae bacterium]|nr:T9SS type A sorting domain-containing protein [Flavobacteriaceae bacterium]
PEETRPLATYSANKSRIQFTQPVNNQTVAVFIEEKSTEPKIYAQNFLDEELSNDDLGRLNSVVYNNPIGGNLKIESQISIASVSVYTILGQEVFSDDYHHQLELLSIKSATWDSGLYLVRLKLENGQEVSFKVLK